VTADDAVVLVQDINEMFDLLLVKHPISPPDTDKYNATLRSVTTDLFGRGKTSKLLKLSKTKLAFLVNEIGHIAHFFDLLMAFLKATETHV
jgi:hypothetical protein